MLTADSITDEQIRELRAGVLVHEAKAADVYRMCEDALGNFHQGRLTADAIGARIDYARARCAEILNQRAMGSTPHDGAHICDCTKCRAKFPAREVVADVIAFNARAKEQGK